MRNFILLAICALIGAARAEPANMTACERRFWDRKTELEREAMANAQNYPLEEAKRRNTELLRELYALGEGIERCNEALRNPPPGAPGYDQAQALFRKCQAEGNRIDDALKARFPDREKDRASGLAYMEARQEINQRYRECIAGR